MYLKTTNKLFSQCIRISWILTKSNFSTYISLDITRFSCNITNVVFSISNVIFKKSHTLRRQHNTDEFLSMRWSATINIISLFVVLHDRGIHFRKYLNVHYKYLQICASLVNFTLKCKWWWKFFIFQNANLLKLA